MFDTLHKHRLITSLTWLMRLRIKSDTETGFSNAIASSIPKVSFRNPSISLDMIQTANGITTRLFSAKSSANYLEGGVISPPDIFINFSISGLCVSTPHDRGQIIFPPLELPTDLLTTVLYSRPEVRRPPVTAALICSHRSLVF